MTKWRPSGVVALIALAFFLILQLAIPISRLGNHDVTPRFGWQMFATFVPDPQFAVETGEGTIPISLDEFMAWPRSDIDVIRHLPDHLCEVVPGAVVITWSSGSQQC